MAHVHSSRPHLASLGRWVQTPGASALALLFAGSVTQSRLPNLSLPVSAVKMQKPR